MDNANEYQGPDADTYKNVLALNTAFISATSELKGPQRGRLAAAPFLLFSLRENDLGWWAEALADNRQGDLMAAGELRNSGLLRVQMAALSFLWHLGRRNPYAARIMSGATISWCEKVTELPLVTLLDRVGARGDLLYSRLDKSAPTAVRLLGEGTSSRAVVRRSSHVVALQGLLTGAVLDTYAQLPAAACRMSGPVKTSDKKL